MAADGTFFNRPKSVSRSARVVHFNSAAYTDGMVAQMDGVRAFTGGASGFTPAQSASAVSVMVCIRELDKVKEWSPGQLNGLVEHNVSIHKKGVDATSARRFGGVFMDAGGYPNIEGGQGVFERFGTVCWGKGPAMKPGLAAQLLEGASIDAIRLYLAGRILALASQEASPFTDQTARVDVLAMIEDPRVDIVRSFLTVGDDEDRAPVKEIKAKMQELFDAAGLEVPGDKGLPTLIHLAIPEYSGTSRKSGSYRYYPGLRILVPDRGSET